MSQCSTGGPNPLTGSTGPPEPISIGMNDAKAISVLSRSSLYNYINEGRLSDCTLGGKRLIIYSELKSLILSGIKTAALIWL
jgi:hypothetical protein